MRLLERLLNVKIEFLEKQPANLKSTRKVARETNKRTLEFLDKKINLIGATCNDR